MLTRFSHTYASLPYLDLITALSVFLIVIYTFRISWIHPLLLPAVLLIFLVFPTARTHPRFWFIVTAGLFFAIAYNWYAIDNHQWIIALWTLLLGILLQFAPLGKLRELMSKNAVLLIALIMLLSVVQKAMEPEFLSGDLFGYVLLVHEDLAVITSYCPEIAGVDLLENRETLDRLLENGQRGSAMLVTGPCVTVLSLVVTYWVLITELLIGILLLFPRHISQILGHLVHMHFIVVTYLAVPVVAFGSLLCVLGIAATHRRFPRLSFVYFLLLFLMVLYLLPLQHIFRALF